MLRPYRSKGISLFFTVRMSSEREQVPSLSGQSRNAEDEGDGVSSVGIERQVSKALSRAMSRGKTRLEKKAAWAFDFYQAGAFFPVDYHYWWTPYQTDCGPTQLTMMHAVAYAEDGSQFGADQMEHRAAMRSAHRMAQRRYLQHMEESQRQK